MDEDGSHVYGGADGKDVDTPAPEGLRGEQAPTGDRPEQTRTALLGDGQAVKVEETSGIAFAEAEGAGQKNPSST